MFRLLENECRIIILIHLPQGRVNAFGYPKDEKVRSGQLQPRYGSNSLFWVSSDFYLEVYIFLERGLNTFSSVGNYCIILRCLYLMLYFPTLGVFLSFHIYLIYVICGIVLLLLSKLYLVCFYDVTYISRVLCHLHSLLQASFLFTATFSCY